MKRLYEGMFLFDANLAGRDWPGLEKHVLDLLGRHDAELEHAERWPDRKLSYEVKGCRKGTHYLTYFRAPPTEITGLHRDCELSDRVLRVLILQDEALEELCDGRRRREEEAMQKSEAAEAAKAEAAAAPAAPAPAPAAAPAAAAPAPAPAAAPATASSTESAVADGGAAASEAAKPDSDAGKVD